MHKPWGRDVCICNCSSIKISCVQFNLLWWLIKNFLLPQCVTIIRLPNYASRWYLEELHDTYILLMLTLIPIKKYEKVGREEKISCDFFYVWSELIKNKMNLGCSMICIVNLKDLWNNCAFSNKVKKLTATSKVKKNIPLNLYCRAYVSEFFCSEHGFLINRIMFLH